MTRQERATTRPAGSPDMSGLSAAEVARRVEGRLTNLVTSSSSRSLWDIVRANVLTLFNAIVAGSFVLLLLLGQWRDALFGSRLSATP